MKKNYEEIDDIIRQALSAEEAKFYDELGEQSIPEMVEGLFYGKNRWVSTLFVVVSLLFFAGAVYCAVQFFNTDDIREMLTWGGGVLMLMLGVAFLKIYSWMQMDKNALIREIKRMELQLAALNAKMAIDK